MNAIRVRNASGGKDEVLNDNKSLNDYVTHPMTSILENSATTLTQEGVAGKSWYISYANWRITGTAATGESNIAVRLLDGETEIYKSAIPSGSANGTHLEMTFPQPIKITAGNSASYTIGASGASGCYVQANLGLFQR